MPSILPRSAWAVDVALWLTPAAVFLLVYTSEPNVPRWSAAAHIAVALLIWLALTVARMLVVMIVPARHVARTLSALLVWAMFVAAISYYVLVIAGMRSWGRVVSWDLIRAYAAHAGRFAEILGGWVYIWSLAAAALCALAFAGIWRYMRRTDWVAHLAQTSSSRGYMSILIALSTVAATGLFAFRSGWATQVGEPLSLSLYPQKIARHFQGHGIDRMRAERLDTREDEARAAYTINPRAHRRNVILIVVDALRADHMSVYGYRRDTTPHLTALARSGALRVVPEVRASCSSSACGMLSLLGSKFVHEFSDRPITLHEVLKRHGYSVHMLLGVNHRDFYGLREVYGAVDSYYDTSHQTAEYMDYDKPVLDRTTALPEWNGAPQLLQFHLMSAHPLGVRDARYARYTPAVNYAVMGARDPRFATNYYDNGVLQVDAVIDELLQTLRRKGYLRNALVVITADHGEQLGENGRYAHARGLDEDVLRIPLLLLAEGYRAPALAVDTSFIGSQVDVAPTVLRELGMNIPRTWSGSPLQERVSRDFIYLRELDAIGLIDQRDPRNVWKYWVEAGEEHVIKLGGGASETPDATSAAPAALRREWRRRYLELSGGATPVPRAD